MKRITFSILFMAFFVHGFNCFPQNNISSEWLINSNGDKWDVISDQTIDKDDNIYLAGNFTSEIKLGESSEKLTGEHCFYISKVTSEGDIEWIKKGLATQLCIINSICTDSTASVYLCGNFKGELNFDGTQLVSDKKKNAFILKLDNSGNVTWGKQVEGVFRNKNVFVSNYNQNSLFFTGSFSGTLTLKDQTYTSKNFNDILLVKFNKNGEMLKEMVVSGKADDLVNDITTCQDNEVILTGSFEKDLIVYDQKIKSNGKKDAFLIRFDDNLKLNNIHQIGGVYDDYGKALSIDNNNDLILTGSFTNELRLNKGQVLKSNGKLDVFLIKFDNTGEISWSQNFGGPANDYVSSVSTNSFGNIYLTGSYRGHILKENKEIESSDFSNDVFLAKYNSHGNFHFMETIGNGNHEFGRNLCLGDDDYIYVSGNYSGLLEIFENESKSSESEEFFLTKLYDCETAKKVQLPNDTALCAIEFIVSAEDDFDRYIWNGQPGNNKLTIDSTGTYIVKAIEEHGCASFDTIIVQLNKPPEVDLGDTLFVQHGETVSLEAPDGITEYLWSDGSTLSILEVNTSNLEPGEHLFWVKVIDENECISEDEVLIEIIESIISGIDDQGNTNEQELQVSISPNPAKEKIILDISGLDKNNLLLIELYSQKGNLLWEKIEKLDNIFLQKEIMINYLSRGTYILQIKNGENRINKKFVVQ